VWWTSVVGLVLACGKADPRPEPAPGASAARAADAADSPPPLTSHRTTSGDIALGNLNGQIHTLESMSAGGDPGGARRRTLVDLLLLRADMAGRIADLERAAEIAEALPGELPDSADAYLTRAGARAQLHRFDDAWADLDAAEQRGAPASRTRGKRASILQARGKLEEALALQEQACAARRDIGTLGAKAALLGELGRRAEALAAFREALASFEDTSPFPVAWLFFQEGLFWEREAREDMARAYYEAALARAPSHAHAAAHLARLSAPARAEAVLSPLLSKADDPELESVMAEKLRERGDTASAGAHAKNAADRYDELVARHPEAFADHAAQFWLDVGKDPRKALDLARRNLAVRKTPKAYELAVLSALSAGDRAAACEIGAEGAKEPRATGMFKDIVRGACEPR
jgi:tetratricopeptide (TPR) repeat protein